MAYTYDTLVADVIANMEEDSTEFVSALPSIVARGQDYLQRRTDAANINKFVTVSISASTRTYDLPSDLLILKSIQVSTASGWKQLLTQTNEYLTVYWPDFTSCTTPKYYANKDNTQIFLAPTPDANYTTALEYVARVTTLSSTNATNWFAERAEGALFAACMMYANMWTKNGEATQRWKAIADEELTVLNNEARRTRTSDAVNRTAGMPENTLAGIA
jgi:hypothetical protein